MIRNEAKIDHPAINAVRGQMEHRALWMYLLCDEAEKKGLDPAAFAPAAIRRCGLYQGGGLRAQAGGGASLEGLKQTLFSEGAQRIFEMEILRCDEDHLDIDFHYCPLVAAWQKQGCSDEEIAKLCDFAMCGDRGIGESFGCELDLPATIARGDDACRIRFVRRPRETGRCETRQCPPFAIRRAQEKDIPKVLALLSQVLELHAKIRPDIFIAGTTKYTEKELREIFACEETPVYVAADPEGEVLGYAFCVLREPPFKNNMQPHRIFFVNDLCVDETQRGSHIGEALFRHVTEEAKRLGCYEVTLNVWQGNEAVRFYEKMGMKPKETQMELIL